jgi:hypothetical protein
MHGPQYRCSKCGHVTSEILEPDSDLCPSCDGSPIFGDSTWIPVSDASASSIEKRHRYVEDIRGYFNCEDGSEYLVVARNGQGFISKGAVYIFLQDRTSKVWQVAGMSSAGFFKKRLVLDLAGQGGERRKVIVQTVREPQPEEVAKCLSMAGLVARSPVPMFSVQFLWTPLDPEEASAAWNMIR